MKVVEIEIEDRNMDGSKKRFDGVYDNCEYTSVSFTCGSPSYFGSSSPCLEGEVEEAVKNAKKQILDNGFTPKVVDKREKAKLDRWLK